ncbi:histidine phosphatase family protein [Zavarzinia sp. CC-PAN008]|uniref:histidine phosphatase family protein n=1 Tax=Zavarzinia sp. CC-PAN008 TaxID=3243332 RepID=UPI003F74AA46
MGHRIVLVRHGKAAASWDTDLDPGLDPLGVEQAEAVAAVLGTLGPVDIVKSPMRRAQETAAPFERQLGQGGRIEPRVSEIPSPVTSLSERGAWLRDLMAGTWSAGGADVLAWRNAVGQALLDLPGPTVVFSHYVAINAAVGLALGEDRIALFAPDYCSRTVFEVADGRLHLVERGAEAVTVIR